MKSDDELWDEIVGDAKKAADSNLQFCCPMCLAWYGSSDEKQSCLESHGVEVLNIEPTDPRI